MRLFFLPGGNRSAYTTASLVAPSTSAGELMHAGWAAKTSISLPLFAIQMHRDFFEIKLTIGIMYTNLTLTRHVLRLI